MAHEKAKSVFSIVSKACQSTDCSASDVQRLIYVSFEQLVRNLDYLAAAKALKATTIQERQWSTEPNGQGFRMAGKEAERYIDKNNIDPIRLIHSVADDGLLESRPVHAVAEENVVEQQRASWFRQTAKQAASMADIPLYTEQDSLLEQGECQYAVDREKAVSSGPLRTAVIPQSNLVQEDKEFPTTIPPGGPPLHVQGHHNTQTGTNPPSYAQGNGDLHPILVKEGFLVSTGTFDRRSHNTWNDLSARYDGAITNLPWSGQDDILGSAPTMAVMTGDVMDDFNLPGDGTLIKDPRPAKSISSTKDGDGPGAAGATAVDSQNPASKESAGKTLSCIPSCFCGDTCERKHSAGCMAYFGCKHSKCPAHIPIVDVALPNSTNDDSGTLAIQELLPTAIPGGAGAIAAEKGSADDSAKAKSKAKTSPKRKRNNDHEIDSLPDGPPSPVRRLVCTGGGANANTPAPVDDLGPRLANTNMVFALSPKPKRPPAAGAGGAPIDGLTGDEDGAQSIEQMIEKELASLPEEMRCTKPDPSGQGRVCLTSLRPGVGGARPTKHLGRCRYKPRNVGQMTCDASHGPPAYGRSNISLPPKSSLAGWTLGKSPHDNPHICCAANNVDTVDDSDPSRGCMENDPMEPVESSQVEEARGYREEAEGAARAEGRISTKKSDSGTRLSESIKSGKPRLDGQGLLHREYAVLCAKKMARSYGCSSVFPLPEWNKQKQELISQCEALRAHPMLDATIIRDSPLGSDVDPEDPKVAEPLAYTEEEAGLFARKHMKAGCQVAELVGETVSVAEAKRRENEYASLIASGGLTLTNIVGDKRGHLDQARGLMFNLNESWVLDATRAGSSARFARRTKDGNCRLAIVNDPAGAMHVYLQAISDLGKDEEITVKGM